MERILSAIQMKNADDYTINVLGVPSEDLIERAGLAVASEIIKRLKGGRVLVCIGKGNNGEDGKVIAKVLSKKHGFSVATLNVSNGIFKMFDKKFDIIVDCIFGTGLNREVEGKYKTAIEKINESGAYVVSCDIPSGLNADTGKPMGTCVKANLTIAIQEYKLGHFLNDGIDYCGEVIAKDIGISIWGDEYYKKLNDACLKKYFNKPKRNVNKGSFGKTAIIGGSKQYLGSLLLSHSAYSALKMGNGYSYLVVPECIYPLVATVHPECIVKTMPSPNGTIEFDKKTLDELMNFDSIAIGMGLGVSEEIYKTLCYLITEYKGRLLIDADGLNTLAKYGVDILNKKSCEVVLTPHVKEFSRLLGIDASEVNESVITLAKDFAAKYGVTLNVKSSTSVITDGENVFINTTGTSGMAKAGSGDVLSGLMAGILAKGLDFTESVAVSAYLFGKAGEEAENKSCSHTLTATEIIDTLPLVIKKYS